MQLRINEFIATIKLFLFETGIINYIVTLVAIAALCLIYALCMYIKYKMKIRKRIYGTILFIVMGALIISTCILFLGMDVTIIAPTIVYVLLVLKSVCD